MTTLWLLSYLFWLPGVALSLLEWRGPRRMRCDCGHGWMPYQHLKSFWLFVIGACYIVSDVFAIANGKRFPIVAAVGAYYLWRWWKHTKNKRKKLKDKALGVVRETAAGLRVVPVSDGAS